MSLRNAVATMLHIAQNHADPLDAEWPHPHPIAQHQLDLADALLATSEGRALAELVEAVVAWRSLFGSRPLASFADPGVKRLHAAVDAWLAREPGA